MVDDLLLSRARTLWVTLAGAPATFASPADVVVSPLSMLCPPGWAGVVSLGGAAIATVPDSAAALALAGLRSWDDPAALVDELPAAETLGPATLAYLDPSAFRPPVGRDVVVGDRADLRTLLASVPAADADESGLAEVTSPAYVVRARGVVVAAAGYHRWPGGAAHVCVLTARGHRGLGLARAVAAAATEHALAAGLLAQWRARPEASRRVGRALGYRELGWQLSVRLA
ncbi:GNAT acetyltransferase [Asanoa hainanensis]|uniref:GNAT acetyltransferase n=1 Tax=Asanoa hainanensis TaxID=560556 RepID=A0A239PC84_9ACTN|nr:GNAT family N-acetyltransferase [Asanoa hainanensis]SNT64009.1 GNAT acetyltransferase [Asanoa hainanensis]